MIVKCQRSLSTTEQHPQMLFYNRARDWQWMGDLTPDWNELFGPTMAPHDNRFFAEVVWGTEGRPPTFVRRLPDQDF